MFSSAEILKKTLESRNFYGLGSTQGKSWRGEKEVGIPIEFVELKGNPGEKSRCHNVPKTRFSSGDILKGRVRRRKLQVLCPVQGKSWKGE